VTGVSAPRALRVAHIDTTHGRRGEVSAVLLTDFPERFGSLEEVRVGRDADGPTCRLEGWRLHRGKVLLKLEGCDDMNAAGSLVGSDVWIDAADAVALPADSYFHGDLIGLEARDRAGTVLGTVRAILPTGGADVLVVESAGRELLIPAARSIWVEVRPEDGVLIVDPPDGLLEINEA
jgi:16S rRNA processing protein RimM